MLTPPLLAYASAGAAFLDREWPGWYQQIDTSRLDLSSSCQCVLGQLAGDYNQLLETLLNTHEPLLLLFRGVRLGFNVQVGLTSIDRRQYYLDLTDAWMGEILARLNPPVGTTANVSEPAHA